MLLGQELKFKNKLCNFKRVPFSVTSQGNTLGTLAICNAPCKGKSFTKSSMTFPKINTKLILEGGRMEIREGRKKIKGGEKRNKERKEIKGIRK